MVGDADVPEVLGEEEDRARTTAQLAAGRRVRSCERIGGGKDVAFDADQGAE
jgi:hypothetical protein